MPIKQKDIDTRTMADYSSINKQIKDNAVRLQTLHDTTHKWNGQFKGSIRNLVIIDFAHILESIDYIKQSCDSLYTSSKGLGNHFIPYTTFYREIMSTIKQVMMKIHHFQLKFDIRVSVKYNNINVFLEREYSWRNRLEHDIDPFYGDYEEVLRVFRIDKMLSFMEMVVDLLSDLDESKVDEKLLVGYVPEYNELPLLQRKKLIHENNENFLAIAVMVTELSYMVMKTRANEELKILFNLVMKNGEISRFIKYTYSLESAQDGDSERIYAYFSRIGLTFCYQFYDKLGLYLKQRYSLLTATTYFKENVKFVMNPSNSLKLDEVLLRCIDIKESREYLVLNALRQAITHKNKWVDYTSSRGSISSLIVRHFTNMTELLYLIINDYFVKHKLEVSTRAIEETLYRTNSQKL